MSIFKTWRKFRSLRTFLLFGVLAYAIIGTTARLLLPPPSSVGLAGTPHASSHVQLLQDLSWINDAGQRQLSQGLFDAVIRQIEQATQLIVVDMFLFNAWQGPVAETHRALAAELTQSLVARKRSLPDLKVVFISDPINTVYEGMESVHFTALRKAGVEVVLTRLELLQDSNPTWSGLWRMLFAPFGNSPGSALPNPFGEGRVSVRSYLSLLNFKANHRKLLVTDDGSGSLMAIVSSANPHDGSSAHRNIALQFAGGAVSDLLAGELALLRDIGANDIVDGIQKVLKQIGQDKLSDKQLSSANAALVANLPNTSVQVLSESRIHDRVLRLLSGTGPGDFIELVMFYLSDRQIIKQLIAAQQRGVNVRVLLDVNSDAFGRKKNGVPNRPVAAELYASGVQVRWCATRGEQCHAKWLHVGTAGEHFYLLGSANYTRRNLHDFNLETNVVVQAEETDPIVGDMEYFFERQWANEAGRIFSADYEEYADEGLLLKAQYRFMEATGLSTF